MLLNNLFYFNIFILFIILFSIFISVIYTFWMIHNLFFSKNFLLKNVIFLSLFDIYVVITLLFIIIITGFAPFIIFFNLEQEIYLMLINKFNVY